MAADGDRAIRYRWLAASPWEADLFLAAEFEHTVHIWSLERGTRLASFDTVFEPGGSRLAIVTAGQPIVVAGAWTRHGVCGYALDGGRVWQNKSRTNVQRLTALSDGRVAIGYERGPALVLDATSGEELAALRGVSDVIALRPDLSLLVSSTSCRLADRSLNPVGERMRLPALGVIDAAASSDCLALTDGDFFRVFDLGGRERARHPLSEERFVKHVTYEATGGTWVAFSKHQNEDDDLLIQLTDEATVVQERPGLQPFDAVAFDQGRSIVYVDDDGLHVLDCANLTPRPLGR
jgi:hypothetical protein